MAQNNRITLDPAVMGGKPCIRGQRVTVGMVLRLLAAGRSRDEMYPYLEAEDMDQYWFSVTLSLNVLELASAGYKLVG